jgi:hypothetical protein
MFVTNGGVLVRPTSQILQFSGAAVNQSPRLLDTGQINSRTCIVYLAAAGAGDFGLQLPDWLQTKGAIDF